MNYGALAIVDIFLVFSIFWPLGILMSSATSCKVIGYMVLLRSIPTRQFTCSKLEIEAVD